MNSIVTALKEQATQAGTANQWKLEELSKMAALEIETKSATIARLTAAHAMQDESLVVLPRHMMNSIEEKMKEQEDRFYMELFRDDVRETTMLIKQRRKEKKKKE